MSQDTIEGHTGELFEAKPGVYDRLLAGSQGHVWVVPPKTEIHISNLGIPVPVPVQPKWSED
jgi:hypothetical protein